MLIFYYIILVKIKKVSGLLLEAYESKKLYFLGNRLSSRDSDNIGNNMGRFYHWRIGRREGTLLRMELLITPVRHGAFRTLIVVYSRLTCVLVSLGFV